MARLRVGLALLCLVFLQPSFVWSDTASEPSLNLFIWRDYIDPELIEAFEKSRHVKINVVEFSDDDQREETLLSTQGKGVDIVCVNENYLMAPGMLGWVAPLDMAHLPNLKNVEYPFADKASEAKRYAVPYFWGTLGIAYRADLVKKAPTGWHDLFEQTHSDSGRIALPSTLRLLVGITLLANGKDFNSENPADLEQASKSLQTVAPRVFGYLATDITASNPLVTGDAIMAPMFNGDALTVQGINPNIMFVYPEEGANIWGDYLVVSKESPNKELAFDFINFLNMPEIALANARFVNYATPNTAAKALADDEYRNNPVIFPPQEIVATAHVIQPLPVRAEHLHANIFVRTLSRFAMTLEGGRQ